MRRRRIFIFLNFFLNEMTLIITSFVLIYGSKALVK